MHRYNSEYTDLCAPLELDQIEWATRLSPSDELLKFHGAVDLDGFVPEMSANTKVTNIFLQIKLITKPANAVFEFSCQYDSNTSQYFINVSTVCSNSQ